MIIPIFFRFWRIASTAILTLVVLFCYTNLPEDVAFSFGEDGKPVRFTSKQWFFYITAALIFFLNLLCLFLKKALIGVDFTKLYPSLLWSKAKDKLAEEIGLSFDMFLAVMNSFLVFVVLGLNAINGKKDQSLDFDYNKLLVGGAILLIIVLFYFPIRLLFSDPKTAE